MGSFWTVLLEIKLNTWKYQGKCFEMLEVEKLPSNQPPAVQLPAFLLPELNSTTGRVVSDSEYKYYLVRALALSCTIKCRWLTSFFNVIFQGIWDICAVLYIE